MIKSFLDLITAWCIPTTILIYFVYWKHTNNFLFENKTCIYNRIRNLLKTDEEIKLYIPRQKISPIAAILLVAANGLGTSTLGFPIAAVTGNSGNLMYYIIPHIIVSFILYKLLMLDFMNGSLANMIITNRAVYFKNIIENKSPKYIDFSEIKKISGRLEWWLGNFITIEKNKGFPVMINIGVEDAFDAVDYLNSIILKHKEE